jgi:uncharacterized repeat protein (TIGR01451 family)
MDMQLSKKGGMKRKAVALAIILLISVSIVAVGSMSPLVHGQTQSTVVYGTVTDENGVNLSSVAVGLYTPNGALVTSTLTDSFGGFVLTNVAFGTYSLHLTKLGYAEAAQSIVVNTFGQLLGTIVLSSALSLSTSILSLVASPGDQVTIPFTLTNSGGETEVVAFSTSNPEGWSASVLEGNYELGNLSVSSGQSMALQLEVTVSSTAPVGVDFSVSITAFGITNTSLTLAILAQPQPTAIVSGRIVDENNNGMNRVEVDAYTPGNVLIKSAQTSSNGSFSIEVPIADTSSLQFSKDGYAEVTKTVSLKFKGETVNLGDITLIEALKLTSSILSTVANPGGQITIPFTAGNGGSTPETVAFSVSYPAGWSARVLDSSGHEVKSASLASNVASNFQLEVEVPLGATGAQNLSLIAVGATTSTIDFTVNVESTNESIISCQFPGKSATPGDTIRFQIELMNPFSVEMRFEVSMDSVPANWTASIKNSNGDSVTEILLSAGGSVNLVVQVNSFASATTGQTYGLDVKAESDDNNVTDSLPITVALTEATNEVTLTASLPEIAITAGNVADYSATIVNLGVTDRLLLLTIVPPSGWTAIFKSGSVEVTTLYLYAGNTSALTIAVTPPSTVSVGSYVIPVQVKSESGVVLDELNLTTTVTGSYGMTLGLSTYLTTATSGGTATFTATVTNSGYSPLTGVVADITLPVSAWSDAVTPVQVGTLSPKESVTFTVVVTTTDTTVSGDYLVTVAGSSDQVSSDSSQVRVTVSTSTSWGIYGIVIAVILIIALILVFRKFKRR